MQRMNLKRGEKDRSQNPLPALLCGKRRTSGKTAERPKLSEGRWVRCEARRRRTVLRDSARRNSVRRRLSLFTGLAASLAFVAGCDYLIPSHNPASSASTNTIQRPVTPSPGSTGTGAAGSGGNEWGWVSCASESEYQEFNRQVRQFLSTSLNPNTLPGIGCTHKQGGGRVLFKGSVVFEGGAVLNLSSPSSSLRVHSQSWIEIHVDTADRLQKTRSSIQVQPIKLSASAGNVDGRHAVLNFQDEKGEIRLEGRIEGEKFKGSFFYKNYTTWKGDQAGYEGNMGMFSIRACRFFQCS